MRPSTIAINIISSFLVTLSAQANEPSLRHSVIYRGQEVGSRLSHLVPVIHALNPEQKSDTFNNCSGAYLAPDIVITAAHCLPQMANGKMVIFPELKNGLTMDSLMNSERVMVKTFTAHPSFERKAGNALEAYSDIALIKLSKSISSAKLVSLPARSRALSPKMDLLILGWGKSSYWNSEVKLRWASVVPDPQSLTQSRNLKFSHFPGKNGETFCPGDSGGPTLLQSSEGFEIIGVQSGSKGCGNPFGLFHNQNFITFVPSHLDWIESVIQSWRETEI